MPRKPDETLRSWLLLGVGGLGAGALLGFGCGGAAESSPAPGTLGNAGSNGNAGSSGNADVSGNAGSSGSAGVSANAGAAGAGDPAAGECHPVGRYTAGKEGNYRPCCAGLTELITETLGEVDGVPSCHQAPHREYACLQGTCGDGICEAAEAPCGCGVDCPDTLWHSHESECQSYRDFEPPLTPTPAIEIHNAGSERLYLQRYAPVCVGVTPTLVQYSVNSMEGGFEDHLEPLDVYGPGCAAVCGEVIEGGWAYGASRGPAFSACPETPCPPLDPVSVEPGATVTEIVPPVYGLQQLPRGCAAGISTESVDCYSRISPDPLELYSISVFFSNQPNCLRPGCEPLSVSQYLDGWPQRDLSIDIAAP